MSALAAERTARRTRQRRVETLLREIDDRRRDLYRLQAGGVQRAGVRDLKRELLEVRRQLRDVVAASDSAFSSRASRARIGDLLRAIRADSVCGRSCGLLGPSEVGPVRPGSLSSVDR
jgi:hypothetical protein